MSSARSGRQLGRSGRRRRPAGPPAWRNAKANKQETILAQHFVLQGQQDCRVATQGSGPDMRLSSCVPRRVPPARAVGAVCAVPLLRTSFSLPALLRAVERIFAEGGGERERERRGGGGEGRGVREGEGEGRGGGEGGGVGEREGEVGRGTGSASGRVRGRGEEGERRGRGRGRGRGEGRDGRQRGKEDFSTPTQCPCR